MPSTIQLSEEMVYINESGKQFPIGQKGETPDGRVFRHSLTGASINASALCQNRAGDTSWDTCAVATSVAVGDAYIDLTNQSDTWAKDELENGFLACETDPSNTGPNCWRIGGNFASSGTQALRIFLADGMTFGQILTAGTDTMLYMPSLYSKIIVHPSTTATGIAIGVTMLKLSSGYYGWIQTHGVCGVMFDNSGSDNTIAEAIIADLTSAGRVENETQGPENFRIGATITTQGQTDGDVMLIYLHIE